MFAHRTNKGTVVYKRKWQPFTPHAFRRIFMKMSDYLEEEDFAQLMESLQVIAVDAVRMRWGAAASLSLIRQGLEAQCRYVMDSMTLEVIAELRMIHPILAQAAEQIDEFIKRFQYWRGVVMEEKHG